ncbi:BgTH12-06643 [Blumeria graminis f. sp. triticale]|uniref:BgTH12-06643 n=1 Tax=Blumeria graminis f. sp. triticale TaxID=1689686 RepID=A0A9W4D428_BLUGR|nr:BgTH12-06643 [Blumeria graminis f. sp. triticale]
MDTGGLAQMSSYNSLASSNGLGLPQSGFTSRRGSNIKSLTFDQSAVLSSSRENGAPTPRTSRSHLLAGLRTAPRGASSNQVPSTAPPTQLEHNHEPKYSYFASNVNYSGPKTSNLKNSQYMPGIMKGQIYPAPDQILAPPAIQLDETNHEQMDANYYAQLVATNLYLAEQQQRLQQQLINVQAAAQQFQGMNLVSQQYSSPPITPQSLYQQQVKNSMQQAAAQGIGSPMLQYQNYNALNNQQAYMQLEQQGSLYEFQRNAQQSLAQSPLVKGGIPARFRGTAAPVDSPTFSRSISPPRKIQSPALDHAPLPPPSAGAFRRGHRKAPSSLAFCIEDATIDSPRTALAKNPGLASAGMSGPGQGRAGEHPIRQPRGPPPLDELLSKPTTKFEGSKNFSTRTRRSAVHNLVRAGIERRRAPGGTDSGSMSPVSEIGDVTLSVTDNDSDSGHSGSGSLKSRPAPGSPRTSIHGAIGSNRPISRQKDHSLDRKSVASQVSNYTSVTVSSDEGNLIGGNFAAVLKNDVKKAETDKKAPKLIFTPADHVKVNY